MEIKTTLLSLLMLFTIATSNAQTYQISFAGTGASTAVDSVQVDNLTQCTHLTISGNDILQLSTSSEVFSSKYGNGNITPIHLTVHEGILDFTVSTINKMTLRIFDICGKVVLKSPDILSEGHHFFNIKNLGSGIYFVKIYGANFSYTTKMIRSNSLSVVTEIKQSTQAHISINRTAKVNKSLAVISMLYSTRDLLKLTGKAGVNRTISMFVPTQNKTETFSFISCADADSNHYGVVQIGTQIWMAENLKTTKYRDGSSIPNVTDSASWFNSTSGAYCNYHNIVAEGDTYGHLYNWLTIADSRNMCPVGWHVPSDSEWTVLTTFLGGANIAGRKLKANCTTRWAYLDSTWGTNETGFTGLCTNYRIPTGAWSMAPDNNHDAFFWSSTALGGFAWARSLRWCYNDLWIGPPMKSGGFSIRCIKD